MAAGNEVDRRSTRRRPRVAKEIVRKDGQPEALKWLIQDERLNV